MKDEGRTGCECAAFQPALAIRTGTLTGTSSGSG
jgi:hypothetical protein